ncbi:MAG: HDIG domain-containing protein, partial [Muribaculaceae bacterium]|nr:HDIG domain-containing protein [Muribaculaceae bacterium]
MKLPKLSDPRLRLPGIFALATLLLVIFMPRPDRLRLNYELNRPWENAQLLAPFDFPVYRDSIEKIQMIDSIKAHFIPVFTINHSPREQIINAIDQSGRFPGLDRRLAVSIIDQVYRSGVVESDIANRISTGELADLRLTGADGSEAMIDATHMRSSRSAYEFIDSTYRVTYPHILEGFRSISLSTMLKPNYIEDRAASSRLLTELLQPIEAGLSVVQRGEKIVDRGEIVTPDILRTLHSYERAAAERRDSQVLHSSRNITIGQILYCAIILAILYFYCLIFHRAIFNDLRRMICLLAIICGFFIFAVIMADSFSSGLYIVPFAIIPIMLVVFYNNSIALIVTLLEILLCATCATFPIEFIFIELCASVVAIFSMKELSRRSQLLKTALLIFVAYVVAYSAVELMQLATLNSFSWRLVGAFAINMVLTSFAYIMIFIVEKVFGFTSVVTLVELADINNDLLRTLSEQCPGTFQHSMAVSNLAADAGRHVGANIQLLRAGALYHDIGKTKNPAFFTENQHGVNPHDTLSPVQSARIIIGHVTDGLKIAEKAKLPRVVRDLIVQHHGKSTAGYVLAAERRAHPGEAG